MMLDKLHFVYPWFLMFIPILSVIFIILSKKEITFAPNLFKLRKFASKENLKFLVKKNIIKNKSNFLLLAFFILIIISLARPRWDFIEVKNYNYDKNLVILLDSSQSMNVKDISPSRFTRAKQEIYDILDKYTNYRVGVIAFTDIPHIVSPLTKDHKAIKGNIKSLNPNDFLIQGSNLNEALKLTINYFKNTTGNNKYVLLISDGDFTQKVNKEILAKIKEEKIQLFIYAIGSSFGGPVFKNGKIIEYKGKKVISKLNIANLRETAQIFSGAVTTITHDDADLNEFNNFINTSQKITETETTIKKWQEKYYVFLIPAMVILLIYFRNGAFISIFLLVFCASGYNAQANIFLNDDQKALKYYNSKRYKQAQEKFSSIYNKGVSAYRNNDFDSAIKHFETMPENDINSQFNLGNSFFQKKQYQKAINSYKMVLKNDKQNKKAAHNLKIAEEKLKQQQKKQNKNKDKRNKDNKQKKEQSKNSNQNNKKKNKETPNKKESNKNKKEHASKKSESQPQITPDQNIFNLIETDYGELLKKKIKNKDMQNINKKPNDKPW